MFVQQSGLGFDLAIQIISINVIKCNANTAVWLPIVFDIFQSKDIVNCMLVRHVSLASSKVRTSHRSSQGIRHCLRSLHLLCNIHFNSSVSFTTKYKWLWSYQRHSSLIFVHCSHTVYQAKTFWAFRLCVRQSGKGVWGVVVSCEAKLPHGWLSIVELMYIFPCFAGRSVSWGKCLSSEGTEIGYQRCMVFFYSLWIYDDYSQITSWVVH